jgi:glucokinase
MADSTRAEHPDAVIIGIDIGGTKTALLAWASTTETLLARDAFPTPTDLAPPAFVDRLVAAIDELLRSCQLSRAALQAAGVAVPGLVDPAAGCVLTAGHLAGWTDVPLAALLTERLQAPVRLERDANAGALGERWRGTAHELSTFAFLALGTGVGAGVVIDGQLYRGVHFAAGELGDLVVDRSGLGPKRGGQGDLARRIGGNTLRRQAQQATGDAMSAAAIEQAETDPKLAPLAAATADRLAQAVTAIATLLDPEAIIVGGGTAEAGEELLEPVRKQVAPALAWAPRILPAALGADAQLYGAVWIALPGAGASP